MTDQAHSSPARYALEQRLALAEEARDTAQMLAGEAAAAAEEANEDVIAAETALADLARLEDRPKRLTEIATGRDLASQVLSELDDRAARR